MKRILILFGFLASFSFAQEEALKDFIKDFGSSKTLNPAKLSAAKNAIAQSKNLINPEVLTEFYYNAATASKNDTDALIGFISNLSDLEGKTYYFAKNKDTKNVEYYFDEATAKQKTANGNYAKMKSAVLEKKFSSQLAADPQIQGLAQQALNKANSAYQAKDYKLAGKSYLETSKLLNAFGVDGGEYRLNSAISYQLGEHYEDAINLYKEMLNEGWTGEKSTYTAVLKGTEERINVDLSAQGNPLYTDFQEKKVPSKESTIYNNILYNFMVTERYEEAITYLETALKKFPNDVEISAKAGPIYYKSGNSDLYLTQLRKDIQNNPNDHIKYFNLGFILSQDEDATEEDLVEAKQNLLKTIELNPDYEDAYRILIGIITKPEAEYVEVINANLESTAQQRKVYKEYTAKREKLYQEILPYYQKLREIKPDDYQIARNLMKTYGVLGDYDKEDEMREVVKELKQKSRNK